MEEERKALTFWNHISLPDPDHKQSKRKKMSVESLCERFSLTLSQSKTEKLQQTKND